jgi:signal transduction histidine kinase/CheY-like chemotaxis protein
MTRLPVSQETWRETLLQRLLLALFPLASVSLGTVLLLVQDDRTRFLYASVCPFVVAIGMAAWNRSWPYAARAAILVAGLAYATMVAYLLVGFQGNAGVVGATCVVLVALLFGLRATLAVAGALALSAAAAAIGMLNGALSLPPATETSLSLPLPWVRTTLVAGTLWAMIGLAVRFVVDHVEGALRAERAALVELRAEQAKRETAEQERRDAERMAAQAQRLEIIGQLATGVAHDINNVLSVVQCWADIALGDNQTERDRVDGRENILAATRQGSGLAKQLLAFSRRNVRAPTEVPLSHAVDGIMKMLGRILPDDVEVLVGHDQPVWVRVDETELNQVLLNLVVNARDAMQRGGRVLVQTGAETFAADHEVIGGRLRAGRWARIAVEDSGPGVDPAIRDKIFEPFFTTKPEGMGTGLGLATVLGIAREGGGGVALESTPGHGARFVVYLPDAASAAAELERPASLRNAPAAPRSARVLLAEDSEPIRKLMQSILEQAGYQVVAAANGQRALEALERDAFDVLCADAVMPGAPVREIAEAFEKRHPQGRVLIVSGHVDEELTRSGIEQGRYTLLRKPFLPNELRAAVDQLLGA